MHSSLLHTKAADYAFGAAGEVVAVTLLLSLVSGCTNPFQEKPSWEYGYAVTPEKPVTTEQSVAFDNVLETF